MRPTRILITHLTLAAALLAGGCKKTDEPNAAMSTDNQAGYMESDNVAMTDSDAMSALSTPDFVKRMALSDMYEIEAAKIAQQRSMSPEVKKFAQMMTGDHGASSAQLKTLVARDKLDALPAMLDDDAKDRLDALRNADKDDFDGTYVDQQRTAHEQAVDMLEGYAAGGDNANLKAFAQTLLPKVRDHLARIKALDEAGADEAPKDR